MDVPVWRGKSLRNSPRSGYQSRPCPELHSDGYRKDVREPQATQFRTTTALAAPCSSVCPSPYTNPKVKTFSGKGVFDFRHGLLSSDIHSVDADLSPEWRVAEDGQSQDVVDLQNSAGTL